MMDTIGRLLEEGILTRGEDGVVRESPEHRKAYLDKARAEEAAAKERLGLRGEPEAADAGAATTCRDEVGLTLIDGRWWTVSSLQRMIRTNCGILYSDSSITRRIRELREARYGGYAVEVRRSQRLVKENGKVRRSREREYRIVRGT